MKKKICFVTAARSEYGLLKWIMKDVEACDEFTLQIVVTGGHLSYSQGHTIDQICQDGFEISYIVDVEIDTNTEADIAIAMGKMSEGFAKAFRELTPDYIVVLGDRYELLPICSTAFVMRIPIIHISGGDVTEGAIDDGIRNAVTMLADYHFPGTKESADNIIRMRGKNTHVWAVGEPGLDAFYREELLTREELAMDLGLDINKKWILMTYHPETNCENPKDIEIVDNCIKAICSNDGYQVVITYANADFGGNQINQFVELEKDKYYNVKVIPSLGQKRYLSFMKQVYFVIGNSSSGIVEAPCVNVPVINIGKRQQGRHMCDNIIQCEGSLGELVDAIKKIEKTSVSRDFDMDYWGDGFTSGRILSILKEELK